MHVKKGRPTVLFIPVDLCHNLRINLYFKIWNFICQTRELLKNTILSKLRHYRQCVSSVVKISTISALNVMNNNDCNIILITHASIIICSIILVPHTNCFELFYVKIKWRVTHRKVRANIKYSSWIMCFYNIVYTYIHFFVLSSLTVG